jgi:hypothetical protein
MFCSEILFFYNSKRNNLSIAFHVLVTLNAAWQRPGVSVGLGGCQCGPVPQFAGHGCHGRPRAGPGRWPGVGRRAPAGGHPVTDRGGLPLARSHAVSRIAPDGGGRVRRLDTAGVRRQGQTRTEQGRRLGQGRTLTSRHVV